MAFNRIFIGFQLLTLTSILSRFVSGENCDANARPVVVCYYSSWAVYRPDGGAFTIENISESGNLCTHLIYGFAGLNIDGHIDSLDPYFDVQQRGFKQFNELKEANPCLKTLIAIGGWNEGSEKYSLMAETAKGRQNFADSVLRFLVHYGFDGLDVDWEYPTQRGGITDDKENFVELLRTLKETLRRRQKLLTIAIGSTPWIIDTAYEVEEMCDIVDLVMIMAYDIQDPNLLTVHAPLKREDDPDALQLLATIDDGITHLLSLNCPAKKIVLGIGAFGRTFTMKSATEHEIGDPVAGLGKAGPYLRADGSLGFNEICEDQLKNDWTVEQLSGNAMSIAYKGKQWVSYDDETSIEIKAAYAVEHKLGGLMLYSMDTDDFQGNCFGYSYPLLRAINKGLGRNVD